MSSSFSAISMTYHNEFPKSQPCEPGVYGELGSWMEESMQHDSHHSDKFVLSTDRSFYNWYDITHLNFVSKFWH